MIKSTIDPNSVLQDQAKNAQQAKRVGVLTIGQSPRVDHLGDDVRAVLGPSTTVLERGALDGMSEEQIAAIAPTDPAEYRLVTLLRNGRSVEIAKTPILERLQAQIHDLEQNEHVDATLLMCTGAFPRFDHSRPLLAPQEALYGAVAGIAGDGTIAALIPLESQREQALRKWRDYGLEGAQVFPASPYCDDPVGVVRHASAQARQAGATVLFMDCFGYDRSMKMAARECFQGPVVLARTLAARLVAELGE